MQVDKDVDGLPVVKNEEVRDTEMKDENNDAEDNHDVKAINTASMQVKSKAVELNVNSIFDLEDEVNR